MLSIWSLIFHNTYFFFAFLISFAALLWAFLWVRIFILRFFLKHKLFLGKRTIFQLNLFVLFLFFRWHWLWFYFWLNIWYLYSVWFLVARRCEILVWKFLYCHCFIILISILYVLNLLHHVFVLCGHIIQSF